MSQELHYTSVPRGLKPGARGFCTVASTVGLSPTLAERLEGLSGYRAPFPPDHPQAATNPVAWSHLRINSVGQTISVISRVGPAGLDYTERPNKYAHHVVLESADRPAAGPAWTLEQPGFMATEWHGAPQQIMTGRRPPQGDRPGGICRAWAARTGDAGWGGVLAESFLADPRRPVILVFDPGVDVLPLFAEAIALLPSDRRWEVTFQTYFTGLPPGATCHWRAVSRDTPEDRQSRGNPEGLLIDLAAAGRAAGGALVHWARTGEAPTAASPTTTEPTPTPPRTEAPPQAAPRKSGARAVATVTAHDPYTLGPPPVVAAPRPSRRSEPREPRRSDGSLVWQMIALSLFAFILGGGAGGLAVFMMMRTRVPAPAPTSVARAETRPGTLSPSVDPRGAVEDSGKKKSLDVVAHSPPPKGSNESIRQGRQGDAPHGAGSDAPKPTRPQRDRPEDQRVVKAAEAPTPRTDVIATPNAAGGTAGTTPSSNPAGSPGGRSRAIDAAKLGQFELKRAQNIRPSYSIRTEEKVSRLELIGGRDERENKLAFNTESMDMGTGLKVSEQHGAEDSIEVGQFSVSGGSILFDWKVRDGRDDIEKFLRTCVLKIEYENGQSDFLLLNAVKFVEKPKWDERTLRISWIDGEWPLGKERFPSIGSIEIEAPGKRRIRLKAQQKAGGSSPVFISEELQQQWSLLNNKPYELSMSPVKSKDQNKAQLEAGSRLWAEIAIDVGDRRFLLTTVEADLSK